MAAIAHRLRYETLEVRRLTAVDVVKTLDVAVQTSDTVGLRGAEIRLNYDTQSLDLRAEDIRPGAAWLGSASLISNVDDEQGTVNVFMFSIEPIGASREPLLDLKFQVAGDVVADVAMATLSQTILNEGAIEGEAGLTARHGIEVTESQSERVAAQPTTINTTTTTVADDLAGETTAWADLTESLEVKACSAWEPTAAAVSGNESRATLPTMSAPLLSETISASDLAAPIIELKKNTALDV